MQLRRATLRELIPRICLLYFLVSLPRRAVGCSPANAIKGQELGGGPGSQFIPLSVQRVELPQVTEPQGTWTTCLDGNKFKLLTQLCVNHAELRSWMNLTGL